MKKNTDTEDIMKRIDIVMKGLNLKETDPEIIALDNVLKLLDDAPPDLEEGEWKKLSSKEKKDRIKFNKKLDPLLKKLGQKYD